MLVGLCDAYDSPVAGTVRFLRLAPVGVGYDACDDWGGWVLRLLFGLRALASGCVLFGILFSVLLGWAFRIVL